MDPAQRLDELFRAIDATGAVFFPIRHHSPACAEHLRTLIAELQPASVLVEGPEDFDPLIPLLLDPRTEPPVAVYTTYVDTARRVAKGGEVGGPDAGQPARFAAYYPLCAYSPELVALAAGEACGARLRFIDLTYPEQVAAEGGDRGGEHGPRVESLLAETHLRRSEYLKSLARQSGCRDPDDLWDHLFEVRQRTTPTADFLRQVAAYCLMARLDHPDETLEADGTLARERAMAAAIRDELEENAAAGRQGTVLVVTGGFHTVALPHLVAAGKVSRPTRLELADDEGTTVLMRYSFDRLDALNGYAAGMPSPHYYQRLWRRLQEGHGDPFGETAGRIIVDVGRLTRRRDLPFALSTADEIAAVEQARRLAALRGHPGPTREDLLDALRSCFVKGAIDGEGGLVMDLVRHVLAGDRVGEVPPETGVPPLVIDFRATCERLRLKVADTVRRPLALDIYRRQRHRRISRFLHCLGFLGSPFARLVGGPDFTRGTGLDLLQEQWEVAWSPAAESALIEASVYGSTVPEAALARLRQDIAELEAEGRSRSTAEAVRRLTLACRMGLHRRLEDLLTLIETHIAEDPAFPSLVAGLGELHLLWQSREPLEAHELEAVPRLAETAYRRACFLAPELGAVGEEEEGAVLEALADLHQLAVATEDTYDRDLLTGALESLVRPGSAPRPAIAGGAAGILFGSGRMDEERLLALARGHLAGATGDPGAGSGFLRGLLATCREAAWRLPGLLKELDRLLAAWDEDDFVGALPNLRLAFSSLTPREVDRVAAAIGGFHGREDLGELVHAAIGEQEVLFNLGVGRRVAEALDRDGLGAWIRAVKPTDPPQDSISSPRQPRSSSTERS